MLTTEEMQVLIEGAPVIGRLNNKWRQRRVLVFAHPDPSRVISVGYPYGGGKPVVCDESREGWERVLDMFPEVAIYE